MRKPKLEKPAAERVRMGRQGRIVLPRVAREALGVEPGESLTAVVEEEGRVVLETISAAIRRTQERWTNAPNKAAGGSEELIKERRRAAGAKKRGSK